MCGWKGEILGTYFHGSLRLRKPVWTTSAWVRWGAKLCRQKARLLLNHHTKERIPSLCPNTVVVYSLPSLFPSSFPLPLFPRFLTVINSWTCFALPYRKKESEEMGKRQKQSQKEINERCLRREREEKNNRMKRHGTTEVTWWCRNKWGTRWSQECYLILFCQSLGRIAEDKRPATLGFKHLWLTATICSRGICCSL